MRVYSNSETLGATTSISRVLHAIGLIGVGNCSLALEQLTRGLDEVHSYLDVEGLRTFGAEAML